MTDEAKAPTPRPCRHPVPFRRPLDTGEVACMRCGADIAPLLARRKGRPE